MRSLERIPKVLKELERIWTERPDLRLGQLILNACPDERMLYNIEDYTLINTIIELYDYKIAPEKSDSTD